MSCLLAICLSGLYLDGGLSYADSGVEIYQLKTTLLTRETRWGDIEYVGSSDERASSHRALNPYGRLALGYEHQINLQLRLNAELYHESSIETGRDRGVNGARVSLRWFPWGGQ